MQVLHSSTMLQDSLIELFKRLPNDGSTKIVTVNGYSYAVVEPVTVYPEFIRFQRAAGPLGGQTVNLMFSAITEISHN